MAVTPFAITTSAYTEIKFPVMTDGWGFWVEGCDMYYREVGPPRSIVYLDAGAVVDNLDGTVTLAAAGHGLTEGDTIVIPGRKKEGAQKFQPENYASEDNTLVLEAAGDANNLVVIMDYVAETILAGAFVLGYKDIKILQNREDAEDKTTRPFETLFKAKAVSGSGTVHVRAVEA